MFEVDVSMAHRRQQRYFRTGEAHRFLRIGITVIFIYPGPFENLSTVRCVALPEIWVDPLLELSGDIWPAIRLDELAGKASHSAPG
jgi:hypothetical protein